MDRYGLDTRQLTEDVRWPAWRSGLAAFAIDASGGESGVFEGRIKTVAAASGISFTLVQSACAQRMSATAGLAGEVFWMARVCAGLGVLDLDGLTAEMVPGDILYGKKGAPCALETKSGFRLLLVNIPASLVRRRLLVPLPSGAVHLSGARGMGRILSGLLEGVAETLDDLDETLVGTIEAALPQFLTASLFSQGGRLSAAGAAAVRASVLQRIWASIEDDLDDPRLSLPRVSAEHGLSVRYVQKLFEETGENFTRYLRRRRLEKIRTELANPLNRDVSITEACLRWGFNDSATFSRAFRAEFGLSPREYRRARSQAA